MKKIFLNPLFLLGLLIRLSLILTTVSTPIINWYVPFLQVSTSSLNFDPWSIWLNQAGTSAAFPYGYVMWLFFLPISLLSKVSGLSLIYGYRITLLIVDILFLLSLRKILPNRDYLLLTIYWLSPIIIIASYLLGFNDLIPVWLLVVSLYFIKKIRLFISGFLYIAAVSAKLSMLLALPFFLIYLLHNRPLRQFLPQFIKGLLAGIFLFILPFIIFSPSGVAMVLSNPEISKIYSLTINLADNTKIYIVPVVYLLMLYITWQVKRLNFELFNAMLGLSFLLIVLLTPVSPGWFIWVMPLLITYQTTSDRLAIFLVGLFLTLYILSSLFLNPYSVISLSPLANWKVSILFLQLKNILISFVYTSMVTVGVILAIRIWREAVSRNDYFRLSRKPFVLGVAGDSGAGKDTFSEAIKDLFGSHSATILSGDNYHLWDRQKPMWQVMTHLNPMANDLEKFANDLISLIDGKSIYSRHYDHQTGRMSQPFKVKSNDLIIASGLHALYLPILRECYNLSVYLDIDEQLRRYFKIRRDTQQRGHTMEWVLSSFEKREPDSKQFIRPQVTYADLILSLKPIHPHILKDIETKHLLRFKLVVFSRYSLNELSLRRVLIGICGLHVSIISNNNTSEIELEIEGEASAQDIALAAQIICPRIFEFLDTQPKWQDGVIGLMQLITLSHINQALTKRFI